MNMSRVTECGDEFDWHREKSPSNIIGVFLIKITVPHGNFLAFSQHNKNIVRTVTITVPAQ